MGHGPTTRLALLVQAAPYENRIARTDADFALAAAALDFEIRIYFSGHSVLQLLSRRNAGDAGLPAGYRAWAALPDLGHARMFAEQRWLDFCRTRGLELLTPVEGLDAAGMRRSWRSCDHVVVL